MSNFAAEFGAVTEPRLMLHLPGGRTSEYLLNPATATIVGRSLECELRLDDSSCSRKHCIFSFVGGNWVLTDLGSRNGTLVNGARVAEHVLEDGDTVAIGHSWIVFQSGDSRELPTWDAGDGSRDGDVTPFLGIPATISPSRPTRAAPFVRSRRSSVHVSSVDPDDETASEYNDDEPLLGDSAALQLVLEQVGGVAATDTTVLLRGESGVGKELIARQIHQQSRRRRGRFVSVNCAALSESLLESELFGHERGAFTGAYEQKKGKFEQSNHGTLLLDEIGEMSPSIQAKFLRVLEGHSFERVGGQTPIRVDVRVVAATNSDLESAVQQGIFRKDLYFRLNVLSIEVPPLRARSSDIPLLAEYFLKKFADRMRRPAPRLTEGAVKRLIKHEWPGNIRELRNMLERVVVLNRSTTIEEGDLQFSNIAGPASEKPFDGMSLDQVEMQHIVRTLRATHWNKSKAAKILGIERSTLDRKLKRNEIGRPEDEIASGPGA